MPPVLESPVSEPSSPLEAQVVTTGDVAGAIGCVPLADGPTLSVQVQDGIGLSDKMG